MAVEDWSSLPAEHTLFQFATSLEGILRDADHREMFGVQLEAPTQGKQTPHTTLIILQKFLRANLNDLPKAKTQLTEALKWRKTYSPLAAREEIFDASKFGGLGFVTTIKGAKETKKGTDTACFNIYGAAAKDPKKAFGDTELFVRWRVALMELTLEQLHLAEADRTIPDYGLGPDPYQAIQIHDYLSVSFFRQPAEIKAASTKIIDLFQRYYPETVSYKYFVNVPFIMQWMMAAMKSLMSKDSIQKMTWLTYGNTLNTYLSDDIPKEYGGTGAPLQNRALTPKYGEPTGTATAVPSKTTTAEPSKVEAAVEPNAT